ncbi:hypothetical protein Gohar_014066 [Gossypium harknessii]|uniref:F-box domain-containing protein n=1 Tax=Gossypium harknessii TaxID=34285 RepID=A0A7J9H3H5_9ROSI|nr:hypothetical protein [Gossypium harknessii]
MCMAAKCGVHYMAVKSISSFYHFLSQAFTFTHQTLRGHTLRERKMADNNSANQTSSAEMVESNQDLLTQILLHFPVKSLLKSRCVSKRWLSLISDPQFAAKISHLNVNLGPSGLYFYGSPFGFLNFDTNHNMLKVPSLSFLNVTGIEILQSCNGLLLLLCSFSSDNDSGFTYCVCNPTTKNFVTVPLPNATANRSIAGINLAFDPSKSTHYKVICVLMNNMQYPNLNEIEHLVSPTYQIEIFSSENKAWTDSGGPFEAPHYTDFEHGVFCNGAIHWLSPTDVSLYFDVETESLKTMAMPRIQTGGPSGYWSSQRFPYFGQFAGCLHLIEVDSISKPRFHILEMKPDHSHWCVKYRVNLNNVASEFPEIARRYMDEFPTLALNNVEEIEVQYYAYSILSVVRGEKDEDVEVVMVIPGKIISHNPRLNTSKLLSSWRASNVYDCMQYKWYNVFHYVESLATL